jgi:hypothetical protein
MVLFLTAGAAVTRVEASHTPAHEAEQQATQARATLAAEERELTALAARANEALDRYQAVALARIQADYRLVVAQKQLAEAQAGVEQHRVAVQDTSRRRTGTAARREWDSCSFS